MSHPREEELLGSLPKAIAEPLRRAIAHVNDTDWQPSYVAFGEALAAASYPAQPFIFPLPSELTQDQRALAEIAAYHPLNPTPYPLPVMDAARRWLGIDPPTVFQREEVESHIDGVRRREPLWRALQRANAAGDRAQVLRLFDQLSLEKALIAFDLGEYGVDQRELVQPLLARLQSPDAAIVEWAIAAADRYSTQVVVGQARQAIIFSILVRSKTPIAERWERLLPLSNFTTPVLRECVEGLHPARRVPILIELLSRPMASGEAYHASLATDLLSVYPELASVAVRCFESEPLPPHVSVPIENQLRELAKADARIAAAVATLGDPITLQVLSVEKPTRASKLTPLQREQLRLAGHAYDGRSLSAKARLDDDDGDELFSGLIEFRVIGDDQCRPLYDALLYRVDSGSLFRAGTTEEIGSVLQNHLELKEPKRHLRDALNGVLWSKVKPARTRKGGKKVGR